MREPRSEMAGAFLCHDTPHGLPPALARLAIGIKRGEFRSGEADADRTRTAGVLAAIGGFLCVARHFAFPC
jgi:hypothetical protein